MTTDNQLNEVPKLQSVNKPLLKKVHCNYLPVRNLPLAVKWYSELFGLTVRKCDDTGAILILGDGQWLFLLETLDNRTANFVTNQWDGENYEMFSLTFEVENITEPHKRRGRTEQRSSRWLITVPADCSSNSRMWTATSLMFGRMHRRADG